VKKWKGFICHSKYMYVKKNGVELSTTILDNRTMQYKEDAVALDENHGTYHCYIRNASNINKQKFLALTSVEVGGMEFSLCDLLPLSHVADLSQNLIFVDCESAAQCSVVALEEILSYFDNNIHSSQNLSCKGKFTFN
jgi:hypothetical protein